MAKACFNHFYCGNTCDEDDFCHGCREYVCEECSRNGSLPFGGHDPADHLVNPEEDDLWEE